MAAAVAGAEPGVAVAPPAEEPGSGSLCAAPLRLARLPLARVKALVKADPDVSLASQEAVFVLARATVLLPLHCLFGQDRDLDDHELGKTQPEPEDDGREESEELAEGCLLLLLKELFVETIAKDAYVYAQQGKRKTLQRKDLDNAIEAIDEFAFLEGTLD